MNTLRLHSKLKKIVFLIYTFVREDKKKLNNKFNIVWQKCVICGLLTSQVVIKLKVISNV